MTNVDFSPARRAMHTQTMSFGNACVSNSSQRAFGPQGAAMPPAWQTHGVSNTAMRRYHTGDDPKSFAEILMSPLRAATATQTGKIITATIVLLGLLSVLL